jgi:chemotaxis protein methyltransferase CheR
MVNSTIATPVSDQVSDRQMQAYTDLIYKVTGIRIPQQKKTLMSNRIRRRLRATGIDGFDAYLQHLLKLARVDSEWDAFLEEITTHETYLFRDEAQWQWFRDEFLPAVTEEARHGRRSRSLRIWSAAASTGDEAFTIASCIAARLPNFSQWKVTILGTDIGVSTLEEAREATFGERAMRLVPQDMKRRFFTQLDEKRWQAKDVLRNMTEFRQHNLLDALKEQPFDVVFLKNVLIYFDKESKLPVIRNVRQMLRPDGYLVSGPSEGISNCLSDMQRVQTWLFQESTK